MARPGDLSTDRLIGVASVAAVATAVAFAPVLAVSFRDYADWSDLRLPMGATGILLALHVRHLRHALRGERAPGAPWTLAAMAMVSVAVGVVAAPELGPGWLYMFHLVAASTFFALPFRPALAVGVGLLVTVTVWALGEGLGADQAVWTSFAVGTRTLPPVVLVWLVVALQRLEVARRTLAERGVALERTRVEDACRRTIDIDLDLLVAQAVRANAHPDRDRAALEADLRDMVDRARRTRAEARRMLRRPTTSGRAELDTALTLLRAAGIDAVVDAPEAELPAAWSAAQSRSLRELITRVLEEAPAGQVRIGLDGQEGREGEVRLVRRLADGRPATTGASRAAGGSAAAEAATAEAATAESATAR